MTNYFSLAVVTHPSRKEMFSELAQAVNPDVVSTEDGSMGCGTNHLLAINQAYGHAVEHYHNWIVVLEDDAMPVQGFREQVKQCLAYSPTPLISFYLGTGYPAQYQAKFEEAVSQDTRWIVHPHMRHAVGYCINVKLISQVRTIITPLIEQHWAPDDALSQYAKRSGINISYTNPSLVDHQDTESVIKSGRTHMGIPVFGRKKPRKAHRFGTPDQWNDSFTSV